MTSASTLIRRIERAAAAGRGLRFTPDEADLLRAVLELSEANAQAQALDQDAGATETSDPHAANDGDPER